MLVKPMNEKEQRELIEEIYANAMRMVSYLDEDIRAALLVEDEEDLLW